MSRNLTKLLFISIIPSGQFVVSSREIVATVDVLKTDGNKIFSTFITKISPIVNAIKGFC